MDVLRRIRWSVLVIAMALVGIVIYDMYEGGDPNIALIAIGGLLGISKEMEAGQTIEFEVTFDKAGTYKLYCVPHEALGMTGTITVN